MSRVIKCPPYSAAPLTLLSVPSPLYRLIYNLSVPQDKECNQEELSGLAPSKLIFPQKKFKSRLLNVCIEINTTKYWGKAHDAPPPLIA